MNHWRWKNPEHVALADERHKLKREYGCGICRYRGKRVLGKHTCRIGQQAGRRGYCRKIIVDEGAY